MTKEDNLLSRLREKNRQRSSVPQRDDSLIVEKSKKLDNSIQQETKKEKQQQTSKQTKSKQQTPTEDNTLSNLKAELAQYSETNRHSAIVLEKKLDIELTRYCKEQGITVETFLEASWTIALANPELLKQVTDEAQIRYKSRKEAGRLRRLITMLSKHS
ncbi:MAG: hypothetical protein AB4372_34950 [Xenococcus sp. (in: cyanobacteria)]